MIMIVWFNLSAYRLYTDNPSIKLNCNGYMYDFEIDDEIWRLCDPYSNQYRMKK